MHSKLVFYTSFSVLVLAGGWGVARMGGLPLDDQGNRYLESLNSVAPTTEVVKDFEDTDAPKTTLVNDFGFDDIQFLILTGSARQASLAINHHYQSLTSGELGQLKQQFLNTAARASADNKKGILVAASSVFDELDIWAALANVSSTSGDWRLAFDSQRRASELESDSAELDSLLGRLARSSSFLRAAHEKNNDQLSILALYQDLADLHPHFGIFQLELANAHARLYNNQAAENIYSRLSYDPELGDIARQALIKIKQSRSMAAPVATAQSSESPQPINDIVVPLILKGSSFLIDTSIERQPSRLLLDTGASITALSTELIQRLNLAPTGQAIQLSTANGLSRSQLYRVDSLSLGRLTLKNMVVAEIDLGRRGGFDGLLGTDALNQFKSQYSYTIDNQRNALIFHAR